MIEEGEASHFSGCKRQRRLVTGKSLEEPTPLAQTRSGRRRRQALRCGLVHVVKNVRYEQILEHRSVDRSTRKRIGQGQEPVQDGTTVISFRMQNIACIVNI
jgi:hypothetical protein